MAITLLDYVVSQIGERDTYSGADILDCGVPIMGGCKDCGASLAVYNMYPERDGFVRCFDDIREGYTLDEFIEAMKEA